jgi:hypothetical protein
MSRLVVKSHRPLQFAAAVIALSMLMSFVTWLLLDESHWSVIAHRLDAADQRKLLWEVNQSLEQENAALRERVMLLERTTSLDRQTSALLQDEIRNLQDESFRLKGELEFYNGILGAAAEGKGLDVHAIHVRPLSGRENTYRLKLILTNVTPSDTDAEGVVEIAFEGSRYGKSQSLSIIDISADGAADLNYKFRNFKRVESDLTLPDGFQPQKVVVELKPKDKKTTNIRKVFDWPESARQEGPHVGQRAET